MTEVTGTATRVQGYVLIAIGLIMVLQGWYVYDRLNDTVDCMQDNFRDLTTALNAREEINHSEAVLSRRDTAADRALWLINAEAAGVLKDDPTAELSPADQAKFQRKFVQQLLVYKAVTEDIQRQRTENVARAESHPLPEYPTGACN